MRSVILLLLGTLCLAATAQTGIGAQVGYSRNDHWFRSNVGLGASAERAFHDERWAMRAALFVHLPVNGRHEGTFSGDPQPVSFAVGTDAHTYDRYWSAAVDVEPLVRLCSIGVPELQLHGSAGFGYRHERYDYETRANDPRTGAHMERSGIVQRDRWAHRVGFEVRYGQRPSQVFLSLVCDPLTFVSSAPGTTALAWFQEYGMRFGFIHTLRWNRKN